MTTWSSDVNPLKSTYLWVLRINGDSWHCLANLEISDGIHSPCDLARCTENEFLYPKVSTKNLDLIMQKDSLVIQMIIGHKNFQIIYRFNRPEEKLKLRWQYVKYEKNQPYGFKGEVV